MQNRFNKPLQVALIVETSTSFGRRLLRGVGHYIRENGPWSVYLEQRSIYDSAPSWLADWKGDGIISRAAYPEIAKQVCQAGVPTVDLNEQLLGLGLPLIFNDHVKIGQLAAEHFLDRGFREFGFLGHHGILWSDRRLEGFRQRVEAAGYVCREYRGKGKTLRRYRQRSWKAEIDDVSEWIRGLPKPSGQLACNDFRAVQLLDACRRAEVEVPEEVAVIGVDNESVACQLAYPPLSSVVPDAEGMGYEAAAILDVMMKGRKPPQREVYLPPLGIVTRQSTDVLAIGDPVIAKAVAFIREHACDGINIRHVLRHLIVSRSVLQRRFRKELGHSIHEFIMATQIERVKQLLRETNLTREEIAGRTGFKHSEYLSVVFKRQTGVSLSGYRKKHSGAGHTKKAEIEI